MEDAKEKKSFTAKGAKDAKEKKSFTAEGAKDAKTAPREANENVGGGSQVWRYVSPVR